MALVLLSPPALEPLSLAEAKDLLRVSDGAEDALITRLIAAARSSVERAAGLALISQNWAWWCDGWVGSMAITLPLWPVLSLNSLAVFGEDDVGVVIDAAHYSGDLISRPARLVMRGSMPRPQPERTVNGLEVQFTAGFGNSADDVPKPLVQAISLLVAHWFEHRGDDGVEMPLSVRGLIEPWRQVRL